MLAPTRELAGCLFDAVERGHRAAGREVWPTPRIGDFSAWLRERHERLFADGVVRLRCLDEVEERLLWRQALAEGRDETALLDPDGAAQAARRARRAMLDHGMPLEALRDAEGEEARSLAGWIGAFLDRCRDLDAIAGDELLRDPPPPSETLAWIESPAWRPAARRWLETHAGAAIAPAAVARAVVGRCAAPSADEELAAAAGWMRERLERDPHFRAWILIPDLEARRVEVEDAFDAALAPLRFALLDGSPAAPYAIAGGTPLAGYPQVAAALDWLAASRGPLPFERFSALLRASEPASDVAAAAHLALVDVELRRTAPFEAPLRAWLALTAHAAAGCGVAIDAALARMATAAGCMETVGGAAPMSRWIGAWTRAFEAGPWFASAHWSSGEFQSVERFRELLAQLAAADSAFGRLTHSAAARALAAAARDTRFQPQTGIPPLWLSGAIGDPWLCYDALWVAGLTSDAWPLPASPLPLVPVPLQRRYHVEAASAEARLAAAVDLGARWLRRADGVVFSVADREDGLPATPSVLLPRGSALAAAWPPRPLWRAQSEAAPRLERLVDERAPPFGAAEATAGVATLRAQSRCSFRGFAQTRLRCEQLRSPVPGFDPAERGRIVHTALERIWGTLGGSAALAALSSAGRTRLIAEAVAAALERSVVRRDPGPRWRAREAQRTERLLTRWLELEAARTPFSVERLEQGGQSARHGGLEFSCRIDRIDRLGDGARVLIDYKTGLAGADWRGDRPDNPQLPLYAGLAGESLVAVAYAQVSAAECRFVAESEREGALLPAQRRTPLEGAADMRELRGRWRARLDRLAESFRAGMATVDPTPRACASCVLHGLCRIGDAGAEDEDEPG